MELIRSHRHFSNYPATGTAPAMRSALRGQADRLLIQMVGHRRRKCGPHPCHPTARPPLARDNSRNGASAELYGRSIFAPAIGLGYLAALRPLL